MTDLERRVAGYRIALAVAVLAILYFSIARDPGPPVLRAVSDKIQHVAAFGALAVLADFSFPGSAFGARKMLALLGFGVLIEFIQYFIPYREASSLDLLADCVGIAAYAVGFPAAARLPALQWFTRLRPRPGSPP